MQKLAASELLCQRVEAQGATLAQKLQAQLEEETMAKETRLLEETSRGK